MNYTPSELLQFVKDQKHRIDLENAMLYNSIGFVYGIVDNPKVTLKEDGYYCTFEVPGSGKQEVFMDTSTEESLAHMQQAVAAPQNCVGALVSQSTDEGNRGYKFILTCSPDKPEEARAELADDLYLEFIIATGVNTRGKLLKIMKDAYIAFKAETGRRNRFELFSEELTALGQPVI